MIVPDYDQIFFAFTENIFFAFTESITNLYKYFSICRSKYDKLKKMVFELIEKCITIYVNPMMFNR